MWQGLFWGAVPWGRKEREGRRGETDCLSSGQLQKHRHLSCRTAPVPTESLPQMLVSNISLSFCHTCHSLKLRFFFKHYLYDTCFLVCLGNQPTHHLSRKLCTLGEAGVVGATKERSSETHHTCPHESRWYSHLERHCCWVCVCVRYYVYTHRGHFSQRTLPVMHEKIQFTVKYILYLPNE